MKLPKGIKIDDIRLSSEGVWFHDGVEITHKRTLEYLYKKVYQKKGKYYLGGEKFPVPIIVDDVAFFVRQLNQKNGKFRIKLSDGTQENLDIATLDVGLDNQMYCLIKDHSVKAKLERKIYYELMKGLTVKEGYYGIVIDELFYPVSSVAIAKAHERDAKKKIAQKKKEGGRKKEAKKKVTPTKAAKKKAVAKKPAKKKPAKKVTKKKPVKKVAKKKPAKKKAVKKKAPAKKSKKKKR